MGEYDDYRVEPRTALVGLGMGVTPERLSEIAARSRELEKLGRAKPAESFERVMARRGSSAKAAPAPGKKRKREALPRKGPRPGLAHPEQRDRFGRSEATEDPIILKG
jgi:hypothetical protein